MYPALQFVELPAVLGEAGAHLVRQRGEASIHNLGVRRMGDLARTLAAEVAPENFAARCRAARAGRCVSLRPSEDGMAYLTAHLPTDQAAHRDGIVIGGDSRQPQLDIAPRRQDPMPQSLLLPER